MSITDQHLYFSDNVAVTAAAASDVVDRGANAPALAGFGGGFAGDLFLVIQTGTAFTGAATSLQVDLVSDSTEDLATSPTVHATVSKAAAGLTANTVIGILTVPPGDYERFVGLKYTPAGGSFTTGTIRAFVTRDPNYWRAFAANNPQAT